MINKLNLQADTTVGELYLSGKAYSTERLSTLINGQHIYKSTVLSDGSISDTVDIGPLSIYTLESETYFDPSLSGNYNKNTSALYLVRSDNLDAYGKKVINVATPELSSDAANKAYVDQLLSGSIIVPDISIDIPVSITSSGVSISLTSSDIPVSSTQTIPITVESVITASLSTEVYDSSTYGYIYHWNDASQNIAWTDFRLSSMVNGTPSQQNVVLQGILLRIRNQYNVSNDLGEYEHKYITIYKCPIGYPTELSTPSQLSTIVFNEENRIGRSINYFFGPEQHLTFCWKFNNLELNFNEHYIARFEDENYNNVLIDMFITRNGTHNGNTAVVPNTLGYVYSINRTTTNLTYYSSAYVWFIAAQLGIKTTKTLSTEVPITLNVDKAVTLTDIIDVTLSGTTDITLSTSVTISSVPGISSHNAILNNMLLYDNATDKMANIILSAGKFVITEEI